MLFDKYDFQEANGYKHSYWIVKKDIPADENLEDHRWKVWDVVDEKFTLAVESTAPESALDVVEDEGYKAVWAHDVEQTRVKIVRTEIEEKTAYYVKDPPEEEFEPVGMKRALELLDNRGIDVGKYVDSWYYPRKQEFVAVFDRTDAQGESSRMVWKTGSLSQKEYDLIEKGKPLHLDHEDDKEYIERRGKEIYENSPFGRVRSKVLAGMETGLEQKEIADLLPEQSYRNVRQNKFAIVRKWNDFQWCIDEELDHVIEEEIERRKEHHSSKL